MVLSYQVLSEILFHQDALQFPQGTIEKEWQCSEVLMLNGGKALILRHHYIFSMPIFVPHKDQQKINQCFQQARTC